MYRRPLRQTSSSHLPSLIPFYSNFLRNLFFWQLFLYWRRDQFLSTLLSNVRNRFFLTLSEYSLLLTFHRHRYSRYMWMNSVRNSRDTVRRSATISSLRRRVETTKLRADPWLRVKPQNTTHAQTYSLTCLYTHRKISLRQISFMPSLRRYRDTTSVILIPHTLHLTFRFENAQAKPSVIRKVSRPRSRVPSTATHRRHTSVFAVRIHHTLKWWLITFDQDYFGGHKVVTLVSQII